MADDVKSQTVGTPLSIYNIHMIYKVISPIEVIFEAYSQTNGALEVSETKATRKVLLPIYIKWQMVNCDHLHMADDSAVGALVCAARNTSSNHIKKVCVGYT